MWESSAEIVAWAKCVYCPIHCGAVHAALPALAAVYSGNKKIKIMLQPMKSTLYKNYTLHIERQSPTEEVNT